jgi:hypothetical protein
VQKRGTGQDMKRKEVSEGHSHSGQQKARKKSRQRESEQVRGAHILKCRGRDKSAGHEKKESK